MSLLDKYNSAAAGTNAGNARTVAGVSGVNFFDGTGRNQNNNAPDEYQTEFKPNAAGDHRYGGGGKVTGTYALSTWLEKAVNKVDTLFANSAFASILKGDIRNAPNTVVHKFTPASGKAFKDSASLSPFAKSKAQ